MWVAEDNGKVIAFFSIELKGDKAQIGLNFVKYSEQRIGVGRKLYEHAEKQIMKRYPNLKIIIADAIWFKPSIKFYESLGFKKVKTIIHNNNLKDKTLWMEKCL